jgi:hypothetical protein
MQGIFSTPNDISSVQMKCKYVSLALRIALEDAWDPLDAML